MPQFPAYPAETSLLPTDLILFLRSGAPGTFKITAANVFSAGVLPTPNAATSYTVQNTDFATIQNFTAATAVTVTLPSTLPAGFWFIATQDGIGQVTIVAGGGVNPLQNQYGLAATGAQYGAILVQQVVALTYRLFVT